MQQTIEKIIRHGGDILLAHFGKTTEGNDKLWKGDVESDADRETEAYLVRALREAFPGDAILTEEHPDYGAITNDRIWIIDALDGSRNFVRGAPIFGISIALVENDQLRFGIVYLPLIHELFFAQRGNGAYLNGQPIRVCKEESITNAMIPFIPFHQRTDETRALAIATRLYREHTWQVNAGHVVSPLCYTACGRYEAAILLGLYVWDVAASVLIIEEAGGKVTDLEGKPWNWRLDKHDIVAANPILHEKIMRDIIGHKIY